jgi:hypothetical protein
VLLDIIALGIVIPVLPKLIESMLGGDTPYAAGLRSLRHRLGADAVPILTGARRLVRPLRPPPRAARLHDRAWPRLHPDGAGAQSRLAVRRAHRLRHHRGELLHRLRLHRRRDGAREARRRLPRLPFWVAAAFSLANALYGYFVLPESLPPEKRMGFSWARANPIGSLRLLARHPELLGLAAVAFLYHLAHVVLPSTAVLYASYRYGWDDMTMGLTLATVGVASGLVQGFLIGPSIDRFGERNALIGGLLCGAVGFAIYGLATTSAGFWAGFPVMALWGIAGAASMGIMSRLVGASEQGQLQGANSSLMALAGLIGPGLFTQVFAQSIAPGARTGGCPAHRSCWRRSCCWRPWRWPGG